MRKFYFENMDVWQKGRELIREVYRISQKFPQEERYGVTAQLRRAVISINCNLAEGNSRSSGRDQARFTQIAYGSLLETLNLLVVTSDLEYLEEREIEKIRPLVEEIGNKLNALRKAQLRRN